FGRVVEELAALFAEDQDGLVHVAAGLLQGGFALHHRHVGAVAERLDGGGGNLTHGPGAYCQRNPRARGAGAGHSAEILRLLGGDRRRGRVRRAGAVGGRGRGGGRRRGPRAERRLLFGRQGGPAFEHGVGEAG